MARANLYALLAIVVVVGRECLKSRCVNGHQEGQKVAEKNGEEG